MFKYDLKTIDFSAKREELWEIFKDSTHIFSDLDCQIAGHDKIDDQDKLSDLFYWILYVSRTSNHIGAFNKEGRLIGLAYITHISPYDIYKRPTKWEATYFAGLHPDYRSPEYSKPLCKSTALYFSTKHELDYLFAMHRVDNKLANIAALRCGFEHIDIMKGYRIHEGKKTDYNLFLYRG